MQSWLSLIRGSAVGWIPLSKHPFPDIYDSQACIIEHEKKTKINVSGTVFETWQSTLDKYPFTLLGSSEREYFYDVKNDEYFFDRDPQMFRYILNYYRTDRLHFPRNECVSTYEDELHFFGIRSDALEVCCYEDFIEKSKEDVERNEKVVEETNVDVQNFKTFRARLWHAFENPQTTALAQVLYYVSGFFIAFSVLANIIETIGCSVSPDTGLVVSCGNQFERAFFCIDTACVLIFTVEYVARLYAAPNRCKLMKSAMSIIDVVAVLPFYVGLFMTTNVSGAFTTLRVFRVFRIFKFSRHSAGLRILGATLKSCAAELGFLLFSMSMAIIIFATIMYYAEKSETSQFTSIPAASWYTIVTMTTLGYGDIVPVTPIGKIVGGICSLSGVLVIALPVPVIVSNFARIYQQSQKTSKKIAQQASKCSRLKILEKDNHCAFKAGKRTAAKKMDLLKETVEVNGIEENTMYPNHRSIANNLTKLNEVERRSSNKHIEHAENERTLSFAQLQHYHLLSCLEKITGRESST